MENLIKSYFNFYNFISFYHQIFSLYFFQISPKSSLFPNFPLFLLLLFPIFLLPFLLLLLYSRNFIYFILLVLAFSLICNLSSSLFSLYFFTLYFFLIYFFHFSALAFPFFSYFFSFGNFLKFSSNRGTLVENFKKFPWKKIVLGLYTTAANVIKLMPIKMINL